MKNNIGYFKNKGWLSLVLLVAVASTMCSSCLLCLGIYEIAGVCFVVMGGGGGSRNKVLKPK